MDERWTQIRKLFREALEIEPAQWESFLQSRCPEDQVREKVMSMLAAYEVDDTFLEHSAADDGPAVQEHNTATHLVGSRVGPYEIKRSIARGGMGVVFEALDTKLDKIVALKMMSPALVQDPSFRQRFEQEARTLARLEDPHFVRVNALIDEGPNTFIVMEYVDGVTLAQHIRKRGPLASRDAITVGLQLLQALSKAHRQGIIHRDLKPSNIMLTKNYEGRLLVKVLDFGIAKNILPDGNQTRTVGAVGTLFYMSPEQARGLRSIDHRTDLYSLGVTLYEAVSGVLPFDTAVDEYTVRRQIVEGDVIPITRRLPQMEPALVKILSKVLSTNPAERYEDAETMRQALFEAMNEIRSASSIPESPAVGRQIEKRKPVMAIAGVAMLAVFLVAAFFIYNRFFSVATEPAAIALVDGDTLQVSQPVSSAPDSAANGTPETVLLSGDSGPDTAVDATSLSQGQSTVLQGEGGIKPISSPQEQAPETGTLLASIDSAVNSASTTDSTTDSIDSTHQEAAENPDTSDGLITQELLPSPGPLVTGILSIRALPFGNIYVDDELQEDKIIHIDTLATGNHTVRIENEGLGTWECTMHVDSNGKKVVNVDFEASIAVTVVAESAGTGDPISNQHIYLDGKLTPYTTPQTVRLAVGLHKVELRMNNYVQEEVVLDNDAGCFKKVGDAINIDPASITGSNPRILLRMRKVE